MQVRLDSVCVSVWVCVGGWVGVCEACTALHSLRAEQGKKKSKPQAKAQTKPKPTKPISADNADADDCNASPLSAQVRCSIPFAPWHCRRSANLCQSVMGRSQLPVCRFVRQRQMHGPVGQRAPSQSWTQLPMDRTPVPPRPPPPPHLEAAAVRLMRSPRTMAIQMMRYRPTRMGRPRAVCRYRCSEHM